MTAGADGNPLLDGPIAPKLAQLAVPGLVGGLMQSFLYVADGWFVGRLGAIPLAGVALVFPLFALSVMLSAGAVGGAVAAATARAIGAKDHAAAGALVRTALVLALFGGCASALIVDLFGLAFFRVIGGEGAVLAVAVTYAGYLFPGIVVVWLFNMLASLLRGTGDMRRPAIGLGIAAATHIGSALLFVSGFGSLGSLGIAGAALSILIGYGAGALYLGLHLFVLSRPAWMVLAGPVVWKQVLTAGRHGLFAGVQSVLTIAMALIVTGYMARLGPTALAGYDIGVRLELLAIPVIFAFGSACIAMAGVSLGAGRRVRAIRIAWTGSGFAAGFVGLIGGGLAVFPSLWSDLFTADTEIAAVTAQYLRIVGPAYAFFGLGLCLYFASQALNSLFWPVSGAGVRLVILLIGGAILLDGDVASDTLFLLVAGAMTAYGLFNALTLRLGPWRSTP